MADVEKVKRGLKFHGSPYCDTKDETCPYWLYQYCGAKRKNCQKNLAVDALSVIEELQAEIERLKEMNQELVRLNGMDV